MDPTQNKCSHIESHGFSCGAGVGEPCVYIDSSGRWIAMQGFHKERYAASSSASDAKPTMECLTTAERKVVMLIAEGHRRESIANQLDIKENTVARHISNICMKLRVNHSLEICSWYYTRHWQIKPAVEGVEGQDHA